MSANTVQTFEYGSHVAYINVSDGQGMLVVPGPDRDVADPFFELVDPDAPDFDGASAASPISLHEADWDRAMRALMALGWAPARDSEGQYVEVGTASDGGNAIALEPRA